MTQTIKRLANYSLRLPVRWTTVAVFAIAIAYSDGFWLTALQGAIGAIERNEPPFMRWLRDATLMLPLVFLAVLVALLCARRWRVASRSGLVGFAARALLVALLSSGVGIAAVAASSLTDYQYQKQHLELMHSYSSAIQSESAIVAGFGPSAVSYYLYCNLRGAAAGSAVTLMEYATLMVHVRAVALSALALLITNLVIATGLLAALKDRLWAAHWAASPPANESASPFVAGGRLG